MAVQFGTVQVPYYLTLYIVAVDIWALYGSAVCHSYIAVLCDTVCWSCR